MSATTRIVAFFAFIIILTVVVVSIRITLGVIVSKVVHAVTGRRK